MAIVVDDGVATGATARAACRAARGRGAAVVVLAAPVIAAATAEELAREFDAIVALEQPEAFFAVSQRYEHFEQLSDEDVVAYLERAAAPKHVGSIEQLGAWPSDPKEETITVPIDDEEGPGELEADLVVPDGAKGLVVLVQGSGSTRQSPRNRFVAAVLQNAGLATVVLDLLTSDEVAEDAVSARLRFHLRLLTGPVLAVTRSILALPRTRGLRICYLGADTGAAAALAAAAAMPEAIAAVVARGGRIDLVEPQTLRRVRAPVLLIVGGKDERALQINRGVFTYLAAAELNVIPGAAHPFEEPGALGAVAQLAARWFERHLDGVAVAPPAA